MAILHALQTLAISRMSSDQAVPPALPVLLSRLLVALLLIGAAYGDLRIAQYDPDASAALQASQLASSKTIAWQRHRVDRRAGVKPRLCAICRCPPQCDSCCTSTRAAPAWTPTSSAGCSTAEASSQVGEAWHTPKQATWTPLSLALSHRIAPRPPPLTLPAPLPARPADVGRGCHRFFRCELTGSWSFECPAKTLWNQVRIELRSLAPLPPLGR